MKTFKQLIAEVAEPKSADELNFKQKHAIEVIDHPVSIETQHSAKKVSKPRRADYTDDEDDVVYEASKMDPVGQEDGDIDNDGDKDSSDEYLHARRKAIAKAMKEAAEKKLDPVGKADADIDNDGDTDSSDEYLHARRKAIAKAMKKEAATSPYAIGMASAMKQTGDNPPLKKSTITKAHKIAKSIMKDESAKLGEADDKEAEKRNKNFWKFAGMTNKEVLDSKAKAEKNAKKESVQIDEANEKKIIAGINAGDSIDVIVQNNLNKRGDNKDEILKVIRDYNWKKRMKKEEVEQIDEVSKDKLKNYMDAARKDMRNRYYDDSPESDKKFANRSKGIEKALDKRDANSKAKVPATESVKLEALDAHIVRGDGYAGVPDGVVMKAKEQVKRMKPETASDHTRAMYKALADLGWEKTAEGKWVRESFELSEAFKAGAVKLEDGSSVIIKEQDAKLLNQLVNELSDKNKDAMMKTAMKNKKGFNEILSFAKEAL